MIGWFEPLLEYGLSLRNQKVSETGTDALNEWIRLQYPDLSSVQADNLHSSVRGFPLSSPLSHVRWICLQIVRIILGYRTSALRVISLELDKEKNSCSSKQKRTFCKRVVDDEEVAAHPLWEPTRDLLRAWRKAESIYKKGQKLTEAPYTEAPEEERMALEQVPGGNMVLAAFKKSGQPFLAPDASQATAHEKRWTEAVLEAVCQVEEITQEHLKLIGVWELRRDLLNKFKEISWLQEPDCFWDGLTDPDASSAVDIEKNAYLIPLSHMQAIKIKARNHCLAVIKLFQQEGCGSFIGKEGHLTMMKSSHKIMRSMLKASTFICCGHHLTSTLIKNIALNAIIQMGTFCPTEIDMDDINALLDSFNLSCTQPIADQDDWGHACRAISNQELKELEPFDLENPYKKAYIPGDHDWAQLHHVQALGKEAFSWDTEVSDEEGWMDDEARWSADQGSEEEVEQEEQEEEVGQMTKKREKKEKMQKEKQREEARKEVENEITELEDEHKGMSFFKFAFL